jgi:hypothetical protein
MPRRFALGLVALLLLLLGGLLVARRILTPLATAASKVPPTPRPTPAVPPTPIAGQRVPIYFASEEDDLFHAETREIPASSDDAAFLRAIASAVLEGPRAPGFLPAFPEGWTLRGAYRLRDGLAVLDLAPPGSAAPPPTPAVGPPAPETPAETPRWQTGSHEEEDAAQALLITVAKNVPDVSKVVIVIAGEPAETLAGHLDLTHPLLPDLSRVSPAPAIEVPTPVPTPAAPEPATASPAPPRSAPPPVPAPPGEPTRTPVPQRLPAAARTEAT